MVKMNKTSVVILSVVIAAIVVGVLIKTDKISLKSIKESYVDCEGEELVGGRGCGDLDEDSCENYYKADAEKGTHRCTWRPDSNDRKGACKFISKDNSETSSTRCSKTSGNSINNKNKDDEDTGLLIGLVIGTVALLAIGGGVYYYKNKKTEY